MDHKLRSKCFQQLIQRGASLSSLPVPSGLKLLQGSMGTAVVLNTVADIIPGERQYEHMELGQYSFGWRRSRVVHTNMRLLQSLVHGKVDAVCLEAVRLLESR